MLCIAQAGVMHSDADMENLNNEQQRQQRPRNYYWTVIEQRIRPKCNEYEVFHQGRCQCQTQWWESVFTRCEPDNDSRPLTMVTLHLLLISSANAQSL